MRRIRVKLPPVPPARIELPPTDINREAAALLGYKRYWGYPCNKNHPGLYQTSNNTCVYCVKECATGKFYPRPGPDYDRQIQAGLEALYGPTKAPRIT